MTAIGEHRVSVGSITYLYRLFTSRSNVRAIRGPGYRIYSTGMMIGETEVPGRGIPYLYGIIQATRGDVTTIGRPRHAFRIAGVAAIGQQRVSISGITHLDCPVPAARVDVTSTR